MTIITEDYISFEVAKLLKGKGFDGECFALYNPDGILIQSGIRLNNTQVGRVEGSYSAPTIQMAMKWLREVHGLHILIGYNNKKSLPWYYDIYNINTGMVKIGKVDSDSYKIACEEAIRYCLENLI